MSVKLGIDKVNEYSHLFEGKRIGLITNHSGLNANFESTIDVLHSRFGLSRLFAPEHGVRGNLQNGDLVESYTDERTGLPVTSLYGKKVKFSPETLAGIDVIAFDIQDVGSRFYTFMYTMSYAMKACKEAGITCVVFDRPNPLGGLAVEGNIIDPSCISEIGLYPIPQRYGLTVGECAKLFNEEYGIGCDLVLMPMSGYSREMFFEDTGLKWVLPSPNIPTVNTCFTFNSTCIFEGTNVSEARGTTKPFDFIGAPWINAEELADVMNSKGLEGVCFRSTYFTPGYSNKYVGEKCGGVELHILDRKAFKPIKTGLHLLFEIRGSYKEFEFLPPYPGSKRPMIDFNTGNSYIREGKYSLDEVLAIYQQDSKDFEAVKAKYHIY